MLGLILRAGRPAGRDRSGDRIGAALAATRLLRSILYDTQPGDPATFAGIAALLGASAILATLVPAWRATRIEPVDAIKSE